MNSDFATPSTVTFQPRSVSVIDQLEQDLAHLEETITTTQETLQALKRDIAKGEDYLLGYQRGRAELTAALRILRAAELRSEIVEDASGRKIVELHGVPTRFESVESGQ